MERVMVLAYPNIFAETSCIVVMEAMASGCRVVTTDLGALKETTAGFARLIPPLGRDRKEFLRQFVDNTVDVLRDCLNPDGQSEDVLRRQVEYMNSNGTWQNRASEWAHWLQHLPRSGESTSRK